MDYIESIAKISLLLPICIFLFYTKPKEKYRWFLFLYIFLFFLERVAYIVDEHFTGFFSWFTLFSLPAQVILIFFFFKQIIKSRTSLLLILALYSLFLIVWIIKNLNDQEYSSSIKASASLIFIISCLVYYYQELRRIDSFFIYAKPEFWGVTSLFIFATGTFFVFLFKQQSLNNDKFFYNQYVYIHALLFILRNLILSVSFLFRSKTNVLSHI